MRILQNLRGLHDKDVKKTELVVHRTHQNQALNFQSTCCANLCIPDDQIVVVSDNNKDVVIHRTHKELGQKLNPRISVDFFCKSLHSGWST